MQDDDSDLEVELEPSPAVNGEASTEAAACVKVAIFLFATTFQIDLVYHVDEENSMLACLISNLEFLWRSYS